MNLDERKRKAQILMTEHGVGSLPFMWTNGRKAIASVKYQLFKSPMRDVALPIQINFSRRWATVLPDDDFWEVMIHEIAHVLTVNESKLHGPAFKAKVREMGGKATKYCFEPSVYIDGSPRKG